MDMLTARSMIRNEGNERSSTVMKYIDETAVVNGERYGEYIYNCKFGKEKPKKKTVFEKFLKINPS